MRRVLRRFAAPGSFADQFLLHLLSKVLHDVEDFLQILPLGDVASCFLLQVLELHRASFQQELREFPSAHGARDVQWRVVVEIERVHVALGRDENPNDASVSVTAGSVQWSVAVVIVDRSAASCIQQLTQRLIVAVLGRKMKSREAAEVDAVDEVILLPAELLLVGVLVQILRVDIAQHVHALAEPVPSCLVKNRVAVLQKQENKKTALVSTFTLYTYSQSRDVSLFLAFDEQSLQREVISLRHDIEQIPLLTIH
jgi:hypothetical protein